MEQRAKPTSGQEVVKASELMPNGDGTYTFVASDESVDSYGDIVRADKWDLKRYRSNPIVLFGHDNSNPIGLSTKVWVDGKKLMHTIKFADEGTSDFIDTVRKLTAQKILRAVSVGFKPKAEPVPIMEKGVWTGGYEFVGQELLEISLVSIPANPNALSLAKSMNVSERSMQRIFKADEGAIARLRIEEDERMRLLTLAKLGVSSHRK